MGYWRVLREGKLLSPQEGMRVHYKEEDGSYCDAAHIVKITEGYGADDTGICADILITDQYTGDDTYASGIWLSGPNGPVYPNWHYRTHSFLTLPDNQET